MSELTAHESRETVYATFPVEPITDNEIALLVIESNAILAWAEQLVIVTPGDAKRTNDDMGAIKGIKARMRDKRAEYLDPITAAAKKVRVDFDEIMAPVDLADSTARTKIARYFADLEARRQEALRITQAASQLAVDTAALGEAAPPLVIDTIDVPSEAKAIRTDMATTGMRDNWKFEVVDFAALPDTYKMPDTSQLTAIARKHHDAKGVPGVRFYNEKTVVVR